MAQAFTNEQLFQVSRKFPIAQRKFAFLLKKHPKKFNRPRRAQFRLVRLLPDTPENRSKAGEALLEQWWNLVKVKGTEPRA